MQDLCGAELGGGALGRLRSFGRESGGCRACCGLSADDAAMLKAMLFGDRTGLRQPQRLGFQRTGSFHLFVVSGLHVTLLAGAVFWLARRLRLREWLATLLTLALATGYALLTGFGAPVQRALWMTAIFLVARLMNRERSVLNALGAAALGVLVWSPRSLFEASFQMTFLAVMAIGGIAVPLGERGIVPYAYASRALGDDVGGSSSAAARGAVSRDAASVEGSPRGGVWTLDLTGCPRL